MPVRLMLAATLRKYVPEYNGETGYFMDIEAGSTVRELAGRLDIAEEEVKLIMVEGVAADWETVLKGSERVALFPPVGGG